MTSENGSIERVTVTNISDRARSYYQILLLVEEMQSTDSRRDSEEISAELASKAKRHQETFGQDAIASIYSLDPVAIKFAHRIFGKGEREFHFHQTGTKEP